MQIPNSFLKEKVWSVYKTMAL